MAGRKRPNRAGTIYVKHGSYYGRWITAGGGRANRKLGPVRRLGSANGMTRGQAEQRLRELISTVELTTDAERTVPVLGHALVTQLVAKGRSRSHVQSVETHLRVHLVPYFGDRAVDRIVEQDVARLLARLRRQGLAPKTVRNMTNCRSSIRAEREQPPPRGNFRAGRAASLRVERVP